MAFSEDRFRSTAAVQNAAQDCADGIISIREAAQLCRAAVEEWGWKWQQRLDEEVQKRRGES